MYGKFFLYLFYLTDLSTLKHNYYDRRNSQDHKGWWRTWKIFAGAQDQCLNLPLAAALVRGCDEILHHVRQIAHHFGHQGLHFLQVILEWFASAWMEVIAVLHASCITILHLIPRNAWSSTRALTELCKTGRQKFRTQAVLDENLNRRMLMLMLTRLVCLVELHNLIVLHHGIPNILIRSKWGNNILQAAKVVEKEISLQRTLMDCKEGR